MKKSLKNELIELLILAAVGLGFFALLAIADHKEKELGISGCSSERILHNNCNP